MPIQTNPAGTAPLPAPLDGRITSLPALTAVIGGELIEITSPGNAQFGNSYRVTTNVLAAYVNGVSPIQPSLRAPLMDEPIAVVGVSGAYSREDHVHPSDTSKAPLDSPIFTGTPTAPTASLGTSSLQIATCQFVETAISLILPPDPSNAIPNMDAGAGSSGTSALFSRADHTHPTDTTRAPLNSPKFTGTPSTTTTPDQSDNSTDLATTAFVHTAIINAGGSSPSTSLPLMDGTGGGTGGAAVGSNTGFYAIADHIHPTDTTRAPINAPAFTGVPTAATAGLGIATNQLATTLFVGNAVSAAGATSTQFPLMDAASALVGSGTTYARYDHVHPSDSTKVTDAPSDGNIYGRKNATWVIPDGLLVTVSFYITSGTITIPANANTAVVYLWGGTGGSGGVFNSFNQCASGGTGAAGFVIKYLTGLTPGNTLTYTRGAAGLAGDPSGTINGSGGGTSTIGSGTQTIPATLTAGGSAGSAGTSSTGSWNTTNGTAGGSASGGDLNLAGCSGTDAFSDTTDASIMKGHGASNVYSAGADGAVSSNSVGNPGRVGGCIIWWFT